MRGNYIFLAYSFSAFRLSLVYGSSPEPTVLPKSKNSVFIFVVYGHTQINVQTKMCLGLKQIVRKS